MTHFFRPFLSSITSSSHLLYTIFLLAKLQSADADSAPSFARGGESTRGGNSGGAGAGGAATIRQLKMGRKERGKESSEQ